MTSSHWTLGEHYSCIRWNGDVGSLAKLCMHRTLECPMTCRRTCPVHQNRLWTLTGPHRTLSVGRWAQVSDAFGSCWIDRWSLNEQGHVVAIGAPDAARCVWCMDVRASGAPVICPMALFEGVSLYICVGRPWELLSWHFDILVTLLSWANSLTCIPTRLLAFDYDSWVRLSDSSALIIALHLEALGGLFCCEYSCYSWWLSPPTA
jgi:hypothetical protein